MLKSINVVFIFSFVLLMIGCEEAIVKDDILVQFKDNYDLKPKENEIWIFAHVSSCNYCIQEIQKIDLISDIPIKLIIVNKSLSDAQFYFNQLALNYTTVFYDTAMIAARSNSIEWIPSKAIVNPQDGVLKSEIVGLGGNLDEHIRNFIFK